MSNAADGFLGRDFLDHRSKCRCAECGLERAENKVSALKARVKELEQSNEALEKKYADCPHPKGEQYWPCACSYDKASDVCAVHAPQLKAALARVKELEEQVKRLMAPVSEEDVKQFPRQFPRHYIVNALLAERGKRKL